MTFLLQMLFLNQGFFQVVFLSGRVFQRLPALKFLLLCQGLLTADSYTAGNCSRSFEDTAADRTAGFLTRQILLTLEKGLPS